MRHIKASESVVIRELEKIASDMGWVVEEKADPGLENAVREKVNSVGALLPSNVSLEHVLPVPEGGDVRRALDVVRHAASRHEAKESGGKYRAAVEMLGDSNLDRVLAGLEGVENIIKSAEVYNMEDVLRDARKLDEKRGPKQQKRVDPGLVRKITKLWNQLPIPDKRKLLGGLDVKSWTKKYGPLIEHFAKPQNFKQLQQTHARLSNVKNVEFGKPVIERAPYSTKRKTRRTGNPTLVKVQKYLVRWFKNPAILGPTGADGFWGRYTAKAWNRFMKDIGNTALANKGPKNPPDQGNLEWFLHVMQYGEKPAPRQTERQTTQQQSGQQPADLGRSSPFAWQSKAHDARDSQLERFGDAKENMMSRHDGRKVSVAQDMPAEHIPEGLAGRPVPVPSAEELAKRKPQQQAFQPKLPDWMKGDEVPDVVPEHLVQPRQPETAPTASPYAQLSGPDQAFVRNRARQLVEMSRGRLTPQQAQQRAIIELQRRKGASVALDLVSLAGDLEKMGEHKAARAVDRQLAIYKAALDRLYDITGETGEQLIDKAHPGGGPTMAPAADEGGKVETIVEEQRKNIERATKAPTGKYAFVVRQLVSLANRLEGEGKANAVASVDKALRDIERRASLPFVGNAGLHNIERKAKQVGDDTELRVAFAKKIRSLSGKAAKIEGAVEDQHWIGPSEREKDYWISWNFGSRKRNCQEYDQFADDAKEALAWWAVNIGSFLKSGKMSKLAVSVRQMTGVFKTIGEYYEIVKDDNSPNALYDDFKATADSIIAAVGALEKGNRNKALEYLGIKAKEKEAPSKPGASPSAVKMLDATSAQAKYKSLLSRFRNALRNPKDDEKLLSAFSKRHVGLDSLFKWIQKELSQVDKMSDATVVKQRNMVRKYIKQLVQRGAIAVQAGNRSDLIRKLAEKPAQTAPQQPKGQSGGLPELATGKPRRVPTGQRRRPRVQYDADVARLQVMMAKAGYRSMMPTTFKTGKPDGKWGKETAKVWNQVLRKKFLEAAGGSPQYDIGGASPARQPGPGAIQKAMRAAQYLSMAGRSPGLSGTVKLAEGVEVPASSMRDPVMFMRALAKVQASGVSGKRIMSPENLKAAVKLLDAYENTLRDARHPNYMGLYYQQGPAAVRRRLAAVRGLRAKLQRSSGDVPPSYDVGGGTGYGKGGEGEGLGYSPMLGGRGQQAARMPRRGWVTEMFKNDPSRMSAFVSAFPGAARSASPGDYITSMWGGARVARNPNLFMQFSHKIAPRRSKDFAAGAGAKESALKYLGYLQDKTSKFLSELYDVVGPSDWRYTSAYSQWEEMTGNEPYLRQQLAGMQ